jgi:hypothetical protein
LFVDDRTPVVGDGRASDLQLLYLGKFHKV